jgi:1-acyl-sn-glycerol-3-phosphate acyltransferase
MTIPDKIPPKEVPARYNHAQGENRRRFLRFLIRVIGFNFLVRLERVEGLENIPVSGPAILMINHIAFVDSLVVLHLVPRNIVPMAKVEVYNYPIVGIFPHLWGVIPVRREEVDRRAIQFALDVLKAGEIILVAPEATRGTQLQQGKLGAAYLASRSGAPIIPVAIEGTEGFPTLPTSKRWRGPGVQVKFGRPFNFRMGETRQTREQLRQMTDEAMYVLAAMLPERQRGVYADLSKATHETIEYS